MKRIIFLVVGIVLCLSACSSIGDNVSESGSGSSVPSSQTEESLGGSKVPEPSAEITLPSSIDQNEKSIYEKLLKSSEILTQQMVCTIFQSANVSESSRYPFDNAELDRFIVATVLFMDEEQYIYHNFFSMDDQGYYHFPKEKCEKILKEVFEIENWKFMDETGMIFDSELNEYTIMSGFGIWNGMECKSVESQISSSGLEIVVYYELYNRSQFLNKMETRFLIQKETDNNVSLKYIETTPQS